MGLSFNWSWVMKEMLGRIVSNLAAYIYCTCFLSWTRSFLKSRYVSTRDLFHSFISLYLSILTTEHPHVLNFVSFLFWWFFQGNFKVKHGDTWLVKWNVRIYDWCEGGKEENWKPIYKSQSRIQDSAKYLRWRFLQK